ncbi:hypothetical protein PTE30175_03637 [Pandoraea terrae]|uniref:Lipoprotein n=1 Tax=Pandoraea terrae TaxID=1537710 RepID=A0A5E4X8H9_9BURK|nr:hypothetical protein [Pandoraea terrae]VVE32644.1 hypothetical protein PTE30175_03637 [Pandoraea terrae]
MRFAKSVIAIGIALVTLAGAGCAQLDPPNAASPMTPALDNIYFGT